MKLIAAFLSFPLLLSSVLAPALAVSVPSPALSKRADNITAPYYLKTKALDRRHRNKDGLYVWAYHTGTAPSLPLLSSPLPPFPFPFASILVHLLLPPNPHPLHHPAPQTLLLNTKKKLANPTKEPPQAQEPTTPSSAAKTSPGRLT